MPRSVRGEAMSPRRTGLEDRIRVADMWRRSHTEQDNVGDGLEIVVRKEDGDRTPSINLGKTVPVATKSNKVTRALKVPRKSSRPTLYLKEGAATSPHPRYYKPKCIRGGSLRGAEHGTVAAA
jgi:hypothetical protein